MSDSLRAYEYVCMCSTVTGRGCATRQSTSGCVHMSICVYACGGELDPGFASFSFPPPPRRRRPPPTRVPPASSYSCLVGFVCMLGSFCACVCI